MNQEVQKRPRGRPKGAKNKNRMLSGRTVAQICEYHRFDPTGFLVAVAKGTETSEDWSKDDRLRAAGKLHDSIHNNKSMPPHGVEDDSIDGQFTLLFVEDSDPFALPGQADATGVEETVPAEPVQRTGDPS